MAGRTYSLILPLIYKLCWEEQSGRIMGQDIIVPNAGVTGDSSVVDFSEAKEGGYNGIILRTREEREC